MSDTADRLSESPMPCRVCPNCSAYYLAVRCASCGWAEPAESSGHRVTVPVVDDDASEPDAPTDLELSELWPVSDPPGGSD